METKQQTTLAANAALFAGEAWEYSPSAQCVFVNGVIPDAPQVCQLPAFKPGNDIRGRLIAAAPKLFAALDRLQANPNDPRAHRQAIDALKLAVGAL